MKFLVPCCQEIGESFLVPKQLLFHTRIPGRRSLSGVSPLFLFATCIYVSSFAVTPSFLLVLTLSHWWSWGWSSPLLRWVPGEGCALLRCGFSVAWSPFPLLLGSQFICGYWLPCTCILLVAGISLYVCIRCHWCPGPCPLSPLAHLRPGLTVSSPVTPSYLQVPECLSFSSFWIAPSSRKLLHLLNQR